MILKINNEQYECVKTAPNGFVGDDIVNKGLEYIDKIYKKTESRTKMDLSEYNLYGYIDKEINAFSIKHNGEYIIGISTGALIEIWKWFHLWFSNPKIYNVFSLDETNKSDYMETCYEFALQFLFAHELYHIRNGHCDLPENEERFLYEQSMEVHPDQALFEQVLEYDADCCGIAACVNQLCFDTLDINEIKEKMKLFGFAIYSIFFLFSRDEKIDFYTFITDDLFKYDHPNAGLRYFYTGANVATVLVRVFSKPIADMLISNYINSAMKFELKIMKNKKIREHIISITLTKKGSNHMQLLHNTWEKVAEKLSKYAIGSLPSYQKIDLNMEFINENGELIKKCIKETEQEENA